jgi:Na+-transporting NADH:ubiquinone oxidoreductase subunit NqrC
MVAPPPGPGVEGRPIDVYRETPGRHSEVRNRDWQHTFGGRHRNLALGMEAIAFK